MKLAFVISSLGAGGAERACTTLANYWVEAGWTITIVTITSHGEDYYKLDDRIHRVKLFCLGSSSSLLSALRNNILRVWRLRKSLQIIDADVAVSFMDQSNVLLALTTWWPSRTICIGAERIHPSKASLGFLWRILRRVLYGNLWAVVSLTAKSSQWLKKYTQASRVPVIPNTCQWPIPNYGPLLVPPQKRGRRLLSVGRLHPQKGYDILLPIFANLAQRFSEFDLVIVGEGIERNRLHTMISQLGLEHRVLLPGNAGNISDWYRDSDIFVMPSRYEGFPMALLEAMASGLPCVSFDCDTGPSDIIRHGIDGILVPPNDVVRLESELAQLMQEPIRCSELGNRAREVRTRFSIERISRLWEMLFEEAVLWHRGLN